MAHLVDVLSYKPEGRGFDFLLSLSFRPHYGPGFDPANNRNEAAGA
jgi:hypothetical protein